MKVVAGHDMKGNASDPQESPMLVARSQLEPSYPKQRHAFPVPKLRLQFGDLRHPGADVFLTRYRGGIDLVLQVQTVLNLLYQAKDLRPETRSITLVVREFDGVAYTMGIELDSDHKEIHLSADYICAIQDPEREILGVICHELVHCFQWAADGTCPGGLLEGIADWVRLQSGLAAKHWKRDITGDWDQGYQHTAFFLDYLESRFGSGTVRKLNAGLRCGPYSQKILFQECCEGNNVAELWEDYKKDSKHAAESAVEYETSVRL